MTGEVLSESEEWAKVKINGTVGYVSKEFIRITCELNYAVSAEEEAAREAELRAQAEAEAARKAKEREVSYILKENLQLCSAYGYSFSFFHLSY